MLGKPVWQAFEGEKKGDSWAERGVRACEEGEMGCRCSPFYFAHGLTRKFPFPFLSNACHAGYLHV